MHVWGLLSSSHTSPRVCPVTVFEINFCTLYVQHVQRRFSGSGGDSCTLTLGGCKGKHTHRGAFLLDLCIWDESTEQENELMLIPLAQILHAGSDNRGWRRREAKYLHTSTTRWLHPHCTRHANHLHQLQHLGTHLNSEELQSHICCTCEQQMWTNIFT